MTSDRAPSTDWLRLIQAEYREIPGLRLTKPQVQRLWGLDEQSCDALLDALTASKFLVKTPNQAYVLADGREVPPASSGPPVDRQSGAPTDRA